MCASRLGGARRDSVISVGPDLSLGDGHAEVQKSRFIEEQIIKVLKEHAAGMSEVMCAGSTIATRRSILGARSLAGWMCLTRAS